MQNLQIGFLFLFCSVALCLNSAQATESQIDNQEGNDKIHQVTANTDDVDRLEEHSAQVIKAYRNYLSSIKPDTQKEITEFRQKITLLNSQKKAAYDDLSKEARVFLAETNKFKKQLNPNNNLKIDNKE